MSSLLALAVNGKAGNTNTVTKTQVQVYASAISVSQAWAVDGIVNAPTVGVTYSVTVNNYTHTHTTIAFNTAITVLNALVTKINAYAPNGNLVTASRSSLRLLVAADTAVAGLPFTLSCSTTDTVNTPYITQNTNSRGSNVFDFYFGALNYDVGDRIDVVINGETSSFTVTTECTPAVLVTSLSGLTNTQGTFYNRFGSSILTVKANDNYADIVINATITNS